MKFFIELKTKVPPSSTMFRIQAIPHLQDMHQPWYKTTMAHLRERVNESRETHLHDLLRQCPQTLIILWFDSVCMRIQ